MEIKLSSGDYDEIRDMCLSNIDFVSTNKQIYVVLAQYSYLVAIAHDWSWNDTEVRDRLCSALERHRMD